MKRKRVEVVMLIGAGVGLRAACSLVGVPVVRFYGWMKADRSFRCAVEGALQVSQRLLDRLLYEG